ncbi:heptaprenyl diphosphate synthase component 1 [Alicyclobacillus cycloheptanicus]|jgi:hypothetical protein|uniref:Heptaprenyl diphosphate synthase n=1 Tax=Alicyclobacillus cycloheptanicus TaxID=1457 RepID=A0ABT9XED5_9BACL|nr:heptaprenyl diphosphate synthase component 1 [Alicyclobacillus cycloheptanicus]MDQ0188495.1 hypothetical protein [Alicyclobacillus cycloheptanicus]WDM01184.1 heptaprenyl diphosphate synthase component 1 [Alicyclobacillus cycloheptanicus]
MSEADQIHFQSVDAAVQQYMHHPFLADNQIRQSTSRFHFGVGRAILQIAHVPAAKAQVILEALLLLQQGLSIHDEVDGQPDRRRQLLVLAGDYDSSQYYHLLARAGQLSLIAALSDAVCRVNEAKMTLVQQGAALTPERYLELRETVEGALLVALATHFLDANPKALEVIHSLVRAYVANEDMQGADMTRHFTVRQIYDWLTEVINVSASSGSRVLRPMTAFVADYFVPIRENLETHTFAEGNRG